MEKILLEAEKLLELGRISDLRNLLRWALEKTKQKNFETYIKTGTFNKDELVPCLYGTVNGQQVFTNYRSLYIMKEPFKVTRDFIDSIRISTGVRDIVPEEGVEEKLLKTIQKLEHFFTGGSDVFVDENAIGDETYTIGNRFSEETFDSELIYEIFGFLGYETKFKLSGVNPVLYGESPKGKGYVLGLKRKPDMEIRRFTSNSYYDE